MCGREVERWHYPHLLDQCVRSSRQYLQKIFMVGYLLLSGYVVHSLFYYGRLQLSKNPRAEGWGLNFTQEEWLILTLSLAQQTFMTCIWVVGASPGLAKGGLNLASWIGSGI